MPKRRLSQNFLYDPRILRRIVQIADINPSDTVIEIGPGPGRLTRMLSEKAEKVIAIEIDEMLLSKLKDYLSDRNNVELIRGDALRYPYGGIEGRFKVVSNIPYHITTPIIFNLLDHRAKIVSMTLTIQKEVAERVAASPGGKDYGVLSLVLQYYGKPRLKFLIPRTAFRPVPRVDSACLHMVFYDRPQVEVQSERLLFSVIRTAFSQRRKTLHNSLKKLSLDIDVILQACGIDPARRPETLNIGEFACLSSKLFYEGENAAKVENGA